MPLTLTIRNVGALDNGSPLSLVLDRRGAIVGRSPTADWCLPDPALHISSRHCEIRFLDDRYELIDTSTNGTFLNNQAARLPAAHTINQGDLFQIGPYEIEARLDDAAAAAAAERNTAPPSPQWQGWDAAAGIAAPPPAAPPPSGWDSPADVGQNGDGQNWDGQNWDGPSAAPAVGWGAAPQAPDQSAGGWGPAPGASPHPPTPPAAQSPAPQGWAPMPDRSDIPASPAATGSGAVGPGWGAAPIPGATPEPAQSPWNVAQPQARPASDWSNPIGATPPPSANDIWGQFAASNVVDWARGGFGSPPPPQVSEAHNAPPASLADAAFDPLAIAIAQPAPPENAAPPLTAPPAAHPGAPPAVAASPGAGLAAFLAAAGVDPARIEQGEAQTMALAGDVLRRLISGLVVLLEARARAKAQLGAQGTSLEFDGNNPLKFARTPDQALAQLLNPPARGFMSSDRAVEDAYKDLQAHQVATLVAMQGALRATLDRFSPAAIRARAENQGVLSKILPTARDAALWKAYEREFSGVALGSDEAFMDMFSKEFRRAYDEAARSK